MVNIKKVKSIKLKQHNLSNSILKKWLVAFLLSFFVIFSYGQIQREMVYVKGGSFIMGTVFSDASDEKPEHEVKINDFMAMKYEVNFDDYIYHCHSWGYSIPDDGGFGKGQNPIINVSWDDAVIYCNWLSIKSGYEKVYRLEGDRNNNLIIKINWDANGFRLPTEAEWEYMATGGKKSMGYAYSGSNDPKDVVLYADNSSNSTNEVSSLKPNELGIYNLGGNVSEWVWDYYSENYYSNSDIEFPKGPKVGEARVYRGSNYTNSLANSKITKRNKEMAVFKSKFIGFRLVKNYTEEDALYLKAISGDLSSCNNFVTKYPKSIYFNKVSEKKNDLDRIAEAKWIAEQNSQTNNTTNNTSDNGCNIKFVASDDDYERCGGKKVTVYHVEINPTYSGDYRCRVYYKSCSTKGWYEIGLFDSHIGWEKEDAIEYLKTMYCP